MSPAELAAGLRRVADLVDSHGLRVLAVSPDPARSGLTVQLGGRLPDGCADVTTEDAHGHRHTTGMLDGVRVTECHPLTADDFGPCDEHGDYVWDLGDGTRWVLFTRDPSGPYAHRYAGEGRDERQIDAIEPEGATVADVVAAVAAVAAPIGGRRE